MARTAFETLIERYADGRSICNCGEAYYSNTGDGYKKVNGRLEHRTDLPICDGGCSANQIDAKEYVAERALKELGITWEV
jgi:hypothetical protein